MMNKLNIALLASRPTSGDTNYIGQRPYLLNYIYLNLITMGTVLVNLWRGILLGPAREEKQTGIGMAGFMAVPINSNNHNYRKFILLLGGMTLPYPTPPKKISTVERYGHTGWGSKKKGRFLIPPPSNCERFATTGRRVKQVNLRFLRCDWVGDHFPGVGKMIWGFDVEVLA